MRNLLTLLLLSITTYAQGQAPPGPSPYVVRLTQKHFGPLDVLLDKVAAKDSVRFQFNRERLHRVHVDELFLGQPTLATFLDGIRRTTRLKWYVTEENVVYVVDQSFCRGQDEHTLNNESPASFQAQRQAERANQPVYTPPARTNFTLTGRVTDLGTGESLPYVQVSVPSGRIGAITNEDGRFTLVGVASDTVTLVLTTLGYDPLRYRLAPQDSINNLEIGLLSSGHTTEEVVIEAGLDQVMQSSQGMTNIRLVPSQLARLPNVGERDIMRSFQLMPGVSAANESSAGLYVRGGTPDQNLILYDGFTVYHVDHLYGFFSAFNANALKDVLLYKGGFESRFGGRLSSVTEITGKEGNQRRINLGGDLSLLSFNVFTEIPIGCRFTSLIAFRKSYQGVLYNKLFEGFNTGTSTQQQPQPMRGGIGGGNTESTVSNYFYDLNGKFTYRPTARDVFSLSIYNGTDKLDNSRESASPFGGGGFSLSATDLTRFGNVGTSLKWSRNWSNRLYGNTLLSYSNYYSTRDRSTSGTVTSSGTERNFRAGTLEDNDLRDFSLKSDYAWDATSHQQVRFGVFGTRYDIAYSYSQNDTATILNRHNIGNVVGAYLQDNLTLWGGKLSLVPGIRMSYFDVTGQLYWEPRLSARYNLTQHLRVNASTGRYYQFANRVVREDILSGSRDFWLLADGGNVPVSTATHYILGFGYETRHVLFSVEGYHKQMQGINEYSLRFDASPEGIAYDERFYVGSGFAQGIEFMAQKKAGKLTGWASYTLGRAFNHFDVYGDGYFPAAQDVRNELKLVMVYEWRRWTFSGTWVYATGRPYTAPEGGYELTLLDGSTQSYIQVGAKNGLRLPDYHRMDLSALYDIRTTDGQSFGSIGLSLFNLYNRQNIWYKEYQIVDGRVVENNVRYLGLTPNITLSLHLR